MMAPQIVVGGVQNYLYSTARTLFQNSALMKPLRYKAVEQKTL
jgi:hypothetical protein